MTDQDDEAHPRARRERSARYPGAALSEAIELARFVDDHGLDGTSAEAIASALGFESIKTRTFSARLSAARQFGLLSLSGDGYGLTPLARSILHPVEPSDLPRLYREALKTPPLYADLLVRLANRRVPDLDRLANLLYHTYPITATAKQTASESFVESARFAGVLGDDGMLRPEGIASNVPPDPSAPRPASPTPEPETSDAPAVRQSPRLAPDRPASSAVRIDLRLWGSDDGKLVRVRAPESMSAESFDRLIQAIRLHVRIEPDRNDPGA